MIDSGFRATNMPPSSRASASPPPVGGFAGGFVARAFSLPASLCRRRPAVAGESRFLLAGRRRPPMPAWLTFAIIAENFTSAIGTVIFVAYFSALCRNPLHTATQYALLTALAAFGRTYLSAGAAISPPRPVGCGSLSICALAGLPALDPACLAAPARPFRRPRAGPRANARGGARHRTRTLRPSLMKAVQGHSRARLPCVSVTELRHRGAKPEQKR